MPLHATIVAASQFELLQDMQTEAGYKYLAGLELMLAGHSGSGIYLMGYCAEMVYLALGKCNAVVELTMPVRQRIENEMPIEHTDLKVRLIEEWKNPQEIEGNPIIVEEQATGNWLPGGATIAVPLPTRLYVVWDAWEGIDQLERSTIILDAYELSHSPSAAANVTLALGLTVEEAHRLGISY
jgi:hypothetical protein